MSDELKSELLRRAMLIGDAVIARAYSEAEGISWLTAELPRYDRRHISWIQRLNLYDGCAGVSLFLLELYAVSKEPKYLNAAIDGFRWVQHRTSDHLPNPAFYLGKTGVAHVALRFFEITGEDSYLNFSEQVALQCRETTPNFPAEFLGGYSGMIFGLLQVHSRTHNAEILEVVDLHLKKLIGFMKRGASGFYFDRMHYSIKPLTGFSHGVSGIALAFAEIGKYLKNDALLDITDGLIAYENSFFDPVKGNWLDLRNLVAEELEPERYNSAYQLGERQFFTKPYGMFAWCHGAPGIGLGRIRLFELTKDQKYRRDIALSAIATAYSEVERPNPNATTICHGSAGNLEFFIEHHQQFRDEQSAMCLQSTLDRLLTKKDREGSYFAGSVYMEEDVNLFTGLSGIGYTFLRVISPEQVPSVVLPKLSPPGIFSLPIKHECLTIDSVRLGVEFLRIDYPRTVQILLDYAPDALKKISYRQIREDIDSVVAELAHLAVSHVTKSGFHEQIMDVFKLEENIRKLNLTTDSLNLLYFKNKVKTSDLSNFLSSGDFNNQILVVDSDIMIVSCRWNWIGFNQENKTILSEAPSEQFCLLLPTVGAIREESISKFSVAILEHFVESGPVGSVVSEMCEALEVPIHELDVVKHNITSQIKAMASAGFLIRKQVHPINTRQIEFFVDSYETSISSE